MMKRILESGKWMAGLALSVALVLCAGSSLAEEKKAAPPGAMRFDTPEAAADALVDAVRNGDRSRITAIVGAKSKGWLLTSDKVGDEAEGRIFLAAYDRKHGIVRKDDGRAMLTVGDDDWEFPAPIVKAGAKWAFDADAGREEILNRRVGRNELDTIQTLLAIVDAQREYAATDADGDGLRDYAQRFASTPGKKDGLYWETPAGAPQSPLGELAAKATSEGYGEHVKAGVVRPYHGYLFKILRSQGPNANGGAYDYMVNGHLFGGFGVLAYPAAYGVTGVKSFLVNHEGVVYEKDLGASTSNRVREIRRFDPDKTWAKSQ
jgi:hypothetical protein